MMVGSGAGSVLVRNDPDADPGGPISYGSGSAILAANYYFLSTSDRFVVVKLGFYILLNMSGPTERLLSQSICT